MKLTKLVPLAVVGLALSTATLARAADHTDAPAASSEPTADIGDLYAWMSTDATKLNLALTVAPFADETSMFSPSVVYAFHVNSSMGYGMTQTETLIRCRFYNGSNIECWAGSEYVEGDPSDTAGITSASGNVRVFAGLRDDPFFMELIGFQETVKAVVAAAGGLTFDADGCPALDSATGAALRGQLMSGMSGAAASDTLAGANVLAIVVQVDKSVVNSGGPILGVWSSTHRSN